MTEKFLRPFGKNELKAKTFLQDSVGNWYCIPVSEISEFELLDSDDDHELDFCDTFGKYQIESPGSYVEKMLGEK